MHVPPRLRRPAPWLAVAAVAVLAVVVWRVFAVPGSYPPARILKFPEEVPGPNSLLFLSEGPEGKNYLPLQFEMRQPAIGEIPVPRGRWATLVVTRADVYARDYSILQYLGEDDLQYLVIAQATRGIASNLAEHIKHLSGLRYLFIEYAEIDDEGLKRLSVLDQLSKLEIRSPHISEAGLNRLRAALPNCIINGVKGAPKPENRRPIG